MIMLSNNDIDMQNKAIINAHDLALSILSWRWFFLKITDQMFLIFKFYKFVFLPVLLQHKAISQFIWFLVFISVFPFFFNLVKIDKLLFLYLKDDLVSLKW